MGSTLFVINKKPVNPTRAIDFVLTNQDSATVTSSRPPYEIKGTKIFLLGYSYQILICSLFSL